MNLSLDGLLNFRQNPQGRSATLFFDWRSLTPQKRMALLDTYYENNQLYSNAEFLAYYTDSWLESMKPVRTPVNRSVNFYAAKVLQGNPRIMVKNKNQATMDAINSFLTWSNFDGNKRVALRKDALYGNVFKKVVFDEDKVYEQIVDPKFVTKFVEDERGFLQEIRMDIPLEKGKTYTEYWTTKDQGYMSTWTHQSGANVNMEGLGVPDDFAYLAEWGIDFIPIVHIKFNDIGNKWGVSCVEHAIVKIDELNRKMTRLAELLFQFNKPIYGVFTGRDPETGVPFAPPVFPNTQQAPNSNNTNTNRTENNAFMYFPGTDVKDLIPNIKWADALAIVQEDEKELAQDLPELRYYTLTEASRSSGIALKMILAGSLDRAVEAQEQFVAGQTKLDKMALTIGQNMGVFKGIGNYDNGDFDHTLRFNEIIETSLPADKATIMSQLATITEMPLAVKMQLAGYDTDEIALIAPKLDTVDTVSTKEDAMNEKEMPTDMPDVSEVKTG